MPTAEIWKYPFPVTDSFQLSLPVGAKILHVADQRGQACMWVLVTHEAMDEPPEKRSFRVFGTGKAIGDLEGLTHIATFFGGIFVWHLFEVKK